MLIASLGLIQVTAQTFAVVHTFTATPASGINSDGAYPLASLILSNNTLFGTASDGGSSAGGTVFAVNTDGTDFTNLHNFTGGSDGDHSRGGLILSGNTLYGTAVNGGGGFSAGTVFKLNTNGTGFRTLHAFDQRLDPSDGFDPYAALLLSGNTLYGTTVYGSSGNGTVFSVNTDGSAYTNIHSFTLGDGANPYAGLVLSGNTLYGTTIYGGNPGNGTIFKLNTNGTGFTNLHNFTTTPGGGSNTDGALPYGALVLSGTTLYGTAFYGGNFGNGTVFAVNTNGTVFATLHSFASTLNSTNAEGAHPQCTLVLSGSTLYGTASTGGDGGAGTVFAVNTDGTGFTNLYSFTARSLAYPYVNSDGAYPYAGLILSGNTLYGTAYYGGTWANGTVFSLLLPASPPQLAIARCEANIILTWPTNTTGFTLQSTTNLDSPSWITNSPSPVVVDGRNTVTNPIAGTQKFYRLSQ